MVDREFTEVDLRQMLEGASGLRPDVEQGRWLVSARHRRRAWEIVVEPDEAQTRAGGHHGLPSDKKERDMRGRYLEVTFRKGRAIAAYLYLPRRGAERAARVSKASPGLLVDCDANGKAIGIEITAPGKLSLASLNRVLTRLGQPRLEPEELAPLMAA
jgi:hypothetical protein